MLIDFVLECTVSNEEGLQDEEMSSKADPKEWWTLYVDGLSNSLESLVGLILTGLEGDVAEYALCFEFPATNNEVEYEALITGIKIAREVGVQYLTIFNDS